MVFIPKSNQFTPFAIYVLVRSFLSKPPTWDGIYKLYLSDWYLVFQFQFGGL